MQLIKKHTISSWFFDEIKETEEIKKGIPKTVCQIPIHTIMPNPYQPRRSFDSESLEGLTESIKKYGVLQPITVRRLFSGEYELVAGERRLRAAALAGMLKIPAIIADLNDSDSAVVALVENIQRENLSFMEEAEAYRNLLYQHGLTQEELASCIGKTQSSVANKVRLLKLSKLIREIIKDHSLSERHARALLRLKTEEEQLKALEKITSKNLNVQQTDELIDSMLEPEEAALPSFKRPVLKTSSLKDMRLFTNTMRHAVELMRRHGIEATSIETEYDEYIEYVITVPKEFKNEEEKIVSFV